MACITSQLRVALIRKLRVIDVLGLFFDMLPMSVCATMQRQTSGRLVQELNVCIVVDSNDKKGVDKQSLNPVKVLFTSFFINNHAWVTEAIRGHSILLHSALAFLIN